MFAVAQNDLSRKRAAPSPEGHSRAPIPPSHNPVWDAVATSSHAAGPPRIQAKLAVSQPGDPSEQEADRVADQVMRMPEPTVQRKCAACVGGGPCPKCEAEQSGTLHRKADATSGPSASSDAAGLTSHLGHGKPLDPGTRAFFEPRFGHDFSHVRVHTDTTAAESARAVNASAYTVGRDMVFARGHYAPQTEHGQQLVAHELSHVVQQGHHASRSSSGVLQRKVRPENVTCRERGVEEFNLTGDEAVAAIQAADEEAIQLALGAESFLREQLSLARQGQRDPLTIVQEQDPRDPRRPESEAASTEFDDILQEELGLTLTNPAHFPLIQQQINRFKRVRETLESGYLRYMCLGSGTVSLVGCASGAPCEGDRASGFSCPGNRLVGLCRPFWFDEFARARTILHESFHIWFTMARHAPNALKRADASCFESFALRVAGKIAFHSCADHTGG